MKFISMIGLMMIVGSMSARAVLADQSAGDCANLTASTVLEKAKADFPGWSLIALPVEMGGWDGGYVTDLNIKIAQSTNPADTVAVYRVMIDETCTIISGPALEN